MNAKAEAAYAKYKQNPAASQSASASVKKAAKDAWKKLTDKAMAAPSMK